MLQTYRLKICFLFILLLPAIITAQIDSDIKITLVNSELTKKLFYQQNNLFNPTYDWEIFFLNHKISYEVIDDSGLDDFDFSDTDVLILPSVEVLSQDAMENLSEYLTLGGSVFILGKLGEFDEVGRRKQSDFLFEISGIKANLLENQKNKSWHLKLNKSNILSKSSSLNNLVVLNQFPTYYNETRMLFNQIFASFNETINESTTNTVYPAIASVENGYGKIIWFGFQLSQISSSESETNYLTELIFNSINWLAKRPAVWVNQFPHRYNSVSVFTFKVEDIKLFTEQILPILKAREITSVFLIEPTEIINSYEYLDTLCSNGEIVIHYDNLNMLDKFRNEIEELLIKSINVLKDNTQQKSIGLFINNVNNPGEYSFLFEKISFDYFIDNDFRIYVKEVDSKSYRKLNNFEYGQIDLVPGLHNESRQLFDAEFSLRLESSDITNILLPSKNYPGADYSASDIISKCFSKFFHNTIWINSYSDLIDWINKRENLSVILEEATDGNMLTINLSNSGNELAERVGLVISLPSTHKNWESFGNDYSLRYDHILRQYNILIPLIQPHQTLFIDLRYFQ